MHIFFTRATMLAALLVAGHLAYGQAAPPRAPYPTTARSDAWMDSVRRLPWKKKLAAVRARVLRDTVTRPYQPLLCYMGVAKRANTASVASSPPAQQTRPAGVTLLYLVNGTAFYDNSAAEATTFYWLLTPRLVKTVAFCPSTDTRLALYGTRAAGGAVLLTLKQPPKKLP